MKGAAISAVVDHLVIGAADLDSGAEWFRATFGAELGPGGRHPLMATHNRLLNVSGPGWVDTYLEVIAIDPQADAGPQGGRRRWFGLDDPAVRHAIEREPRLLHFVARTSAMPPSLAALAALGEDIGLAVSASRATAAGLLQWQITLRDDGVPQHRGALPALIEWQGAHPVHALPASPIRLRRLRAGGARPQALAQAWSAIGLEGVELDADARAPAIEAVFETPRGELVLSGGFPA